MVSVINSATPHQYGTRIRQNSFIKPSARLRQISEASTSSRKSKNNHVNKLPSVFPPPHVMLHPEDASSKVFLAVGRALTSVNNCALTIKDLAEIALNHGLGCQNVSAAGQAITTYIRSHLQRCDAQQDHPLLLRHTLSGTSSDDDLLPALHSRTGGAHCNANTDNRVSSFRRGTMVWYLSKAAGAPCPFARVGIRICDYAESARAESAKDAAAKKYGRDLHSAADICGLKRKRLLRATSKSGQGDDENKRPSKVKLTLRLRPSLPVAVSPSPEPLPNLYVDRSESEEVDTDESMLSPEESSDDDVDTPADTSDATSFSSSYPKRSISCYTPLCDGPYPTFSTSSRYFTPQQKDPRQRSPSVPHSVASLPPDSEDEDDYPRSTAEARRNSDPLSTPSRAGGDRSPDFESDADDGAQRESAELRSPSAPVGNDPLVKEEPTDLQGMLETWDNLDSNITDAKVVEMVAQAAASLLESEKVKEEPLDDWNWDEPFNSASPDWFPKILGQGQEPAAYIKPEDVDLVSPNLTCVTSSVDMTDLELSSLSPLTPLSSISSSLSNFSFKFSSAVSAGAPRRNSELMWKDAELLGPDSIHPEDMDNEWAADTSSPPPKRAISKPLISPSSDNKTPILAARYPQEASPTLDSIPSSSSVLPQQLSNSPLSEAGAVVVHTCLPSDPPVSATQVEGISVYQMTQGDSLLLRRIDTDFVFVSPVLRSLGIASLPPPLMANAVVIGEGSSAVVGTWVPLGSAQAFILENPTQNNLGTFLSDTLFERFPPALQDFHRSKEAAHLPDQFGPHFNSTLAAQRVRKLSGICDFTKGGDGAWERNSQADWSIEDLRVVPQYPLPLNRLTLDDVAVEEMPLSATEQEMFFELCVIPEWEKEKENVAVSPPATVAEKSTTQRTQARSAEPLRRSKRVANANTVAALVPQTRKRTRKRNTRCLA